VKIIATQSKLSVKTVTTTTEFKANRTYHFGSAAAHRELGSKNLDGGKKILNKVQCCVHTAGKN